MYTLLDYIAWITIALAAATILFLLLATCFLIAKAFVRIGRWVATWPISSYNLPAAARLAGEKLGTSLRQGRAHLGNIILRAQNKTRSRRAGSIYP